MALSIIINKAAVAASFLAGTKVADIVVSGGTSPYAYELATGGDYFQISGTEVQVKANMNISNIQSFSVTVTDSTSGTALTATSDVVYPPISAKIQNKFNSANKIYKITRDIDLEHGVLTIPSGSILDFQGGNISNGTLVTTNTTLLGNKHSLLKVSEIIASGYFIIKDCVIESYNSPTGYLVKVLNGDCTVEGCTFNNISYGAIYSEYDNNVNIINNIINGNYTTSAGLTETMSKNTAGIFVAAGKEKVNISNNIINNINGIGIKFLELNTLTTSVNVSNNHLNTVRYGGIILASSKISKMIISGNTIQYANKDFLTTPNNGVALFSAINAHGANFSSISNNIIETCYCQAIDYEGSDQSALDSLPSDATVDEKLQAYQSKGIGTVISNNVIKHSCGISLDYSRKCVVCDNILEDVFSISSITCGIALNGTTDSIVSGNYVKSVQTIPEFSVQSNPTIMVSCSNFEAAICEHISISNNTIINGRTTTPLSVLNQTYVTLSNNVFSSGGNNFAYVYREDDTGVPYINNTDEISVPVVKTLTTTEKSIYVGDLNKYSLKQFYVTTYNQVPNVKVGGVIVGESGTVDYSSVLYEGALSAYQQQKGTWIQGFRKGKLYVQLSSTEDTTAEVTVILILEPRHQMKYF